MVRLNDDIHWHYNTIVESLWLGANSGAFCYLRKQPHDHQHGTGNEPGTTTIR